MNDEKIEKYESKARLEELSPVDTLRRVGFKEDMVLCDIGAGTGIFSIPASEISSKDIYALEKSDSMIEILKNRKADKGIKNLKIKKVKSDILPMEDNICDIVILITVLHHIENKEFMASEIKRILKKKGKLLIIEFHKRETTMGPPVEIRISQEELERFSNENEFKINSKLVLGDNFYGIILET